MIQLINKDGSLYIPNAAIVDADQRKWANGEDRILLRMYGEDCDTINWPKPNLENLKAALFDARECGQIDGNSVTLPDGQPFDY